MYLKYSGMAKNQSTEDYIKGIYKLQATGKGVSTSSLARHLKIEDGSVTGMLKKLSGKKLIVYTPYKGVVLTRSGTKLALQMLRRHRLWEMFLVRYLDYRWDEIHDEAEHLEHVTSASMERRLDKALGHPKFDPHGDPIPSAQGEVPGMLHRTLSVCVPGESVVIVQVDDEQEILKHLSSLGLRLGQKLAITNVLAYDGSVTVKDGRKEHFLSRKVAEAIHVRDFHRQ